VFVVKYIVIQIHGLGYGSISFVDSGFEASVKNSENCFILFSPTEVMLPNHISFLLFISRMKHIKTDMFANIECSNCFCKTSV